MKKIELGQLDLNLENLETLDKLFILSGATVDSGDRPYIVDIYG